jgi:myo-inositol-1-phosphate synthase|tara:strand:+ start:18 stop:494 length:477 start_codon:yes stop_codon:yes gene_type:complete
MDFPMIDDTQNYVSFCQKANLPITELPSKDKQMEMTYELAMKEIDPYLYERLTKQQPLRADVAVRHKTGAYWIEDVKELEEKGYTGVAANLRKQIEEGQRVIQEQKLQEMAARNAEVAKRNANRPVGFHPTKNIDFNSASAAKARRDWNLSDDIGLGA